MRTIDEMRRDAETQVHHVTIDTRRLRQRCSDPGCTFRLPLTLWNVRLFARTWSRIAWARLRGIR